MKACPRELKQEQSVQAHRVAHEQMLGVLTNPRGAAFLLAVYLSALALLLLGGVSLQRTSTELRAAQQSRDLQQAFWFSEAGLEKALWLLRTTPQSVIDQPAITESVTSGSYTYQVKSKGSSLGPWQSGMLQTLYDITAWRPTATGTGQAQVGAVAGTTKQLTGLIARESIIAEPRYYDYPNPFVITGDLAVASGIPAATYLGAGVTMNGNISIGPKGALHPDNPWLNLTGQNEKTDGIVTSPADVQKKESWNDGFGDIFLIQAGYSLAATQWNGEAKIDPIAVIPSATVPKDIACQPAPLVIPAGSTYTLKDGDPFYDVSPTPEQVVVCVSYVAIDGALKIQAPTTIYVTGAKEKVIYNHDGSIKAVKDYSFANDGVVDTATSLSTRPDRGLTVVVVAPPPAQPSNNFQNIVLPGKFEGAIYAPDSTVWLDGSSSETWTDADGFSHINSTKRHLGYVVGNKIATVVDLDFSSSSSSTPDTSSSSILSWTN